MMLHEWGTGHRAHNGITSVCPSELSRRFTQSWKRGKSKGVVCWYPTSV